MTKEVRPNRGLASMNEDKKGEIASKGGRTRGCFGVGTDGAIYNLARR